MRTQSIDTPPEVEEVLLEVLRQMRPEQKLQRMYELTGAVRALAAGGVRRRHGEDLGDREVALRLGALVIERPLMIEAFSWDGEQRGW